MVRDFDGSSVGVEYRVEDKNHRPRYRVGWYLKTLNPSVASVRYRCWHMAAALNEIGVESRMYDRANHLIADLSELDVIVVVKRLDESVLQIAAAAKDIGCALLLDVCDDVLSSEYRASHRELNRMLFRALLPLLDAVITTGSGMTKRLLEYDFSWDVIYEIPDIAESTSALNKTLKFARKNLGKRFSSNWGIKKTNVATSIQTKPINGRPSVVWFGNHGSMHSNFGMLSLLPHVSALEKVHKRVPFVLEVVGNHKKKFEDYISGFEFEARYTPWSIENTYAALGAASVAVLTSGDDSFSQVKSANRALQALSSNCAVVAAPFMPSLEELSSCIRYDDLEGDLLAYLRDDELRHTDLKIAKRDVLSKFNHNALAALWAPLLERSIWSANSRAPVPRLTCDKPHILFVIDNANDLKVLKPCIADARMRDCEVMVTVSDRSAVMIKGLPEYFARTGIIPTVVSESDLENMDSRALRAADSIVLGSATDNAMDKFAFSVCELARRVSIPTVSVQSRALIALTGPANSGDKGSFSGADVLLVWDGAQSHTSIEQIFGTTRWRAIGCPVSHPIVPSASRPSDEIAVFEDLSEDWFTTNLRNLFVRNLIRAAKKEPKRKFRVFSLTRKSWLQSGAQRNLPKNISIARFNDGRDFSFERFSHVICTPSQLAFEASAQGCKVGVFGAPLPEHGGDVTYIEATNEWTPFLQNMDCTELSAEASAVLFDSKRASSRVVDIALEMGVSLPREANALANFARFL